MYCPAAREQYNVLLRTIPMTEFQPFGDSSSARQMKLPAAVLIRMSKPRKCFTVRSTISSTCSGLRTSSCTASASMPASLSAAHPLSRLPELRLGVALRAPAPREVPLVAAGERDPRAERSEARRDRETDPGPAAGHDRNLIFQKAWLEHGARLSVLSMRHVERSDQ